MLFFVLKDDRLLPVEVPCIVLVLGKGTTMSCPYRSATIKTNMLYREPAFASDWRPISGTRT